MKSELELRRIRLAQKHLIGMIELGPWYERVWLPVLRLAARLTDRQIRRYSPR